MELKTPLYDCHVAAGGKIVPFAGYLLRYSIRALLRNTWQYALPAGFLTYRTWANF